MSSVQNLRELITERLTAAAEEIFTEFEKTIVQYEEEIDRQRRLLDNIWKPEMKLHTIELPQQHVFKEDEEVLTEQNVCNQEKNPSVDREDPEPLQVKEEQEELSTNLDQEATELPQMREEEEELCNSQNRQQSGQTTAEDMNENTDSFMLVQCKSKCEKLPREKFGVSEDTTGHHEKEIERAHTLLNITQNPQIKLHRRDLQEERIYKEQAFFTDHLYCKRERNFCLDQKDPEPPQITGAQEKLCSSLDQDDQQPVQIKKEEEELCISFDSDNLDTPQIEEEQRELCSSQEGEQLGTFMWIFTYEESDHSDPKPISGQLLFYNSHLAESPDLEGSNHPNSGSTNNLVLKTQDRNSTHSSNVDSSSLSQIDCDADTRKMTQKCDVCGKVFKDKSHLKIHYRIHTGEKPFACEKCGKNFTQRQHVTSHMRIHTDEKLYLCKTCGRRFCDHAEFQRHTAIHKVENLYSCQICEKNFTRRGNLKVHMKVHTGERPYSCKICGQNFIQNSNLKVHMRIHTGEKPYSCKTCGKSFRRIDSLSFHKRTHR